MNPQPGTSALALALVLALAYLAGCAAIAPPPGGAEDKTPPTLDLVTPPSGTTRIAPGLTVTLVFSERLNPSVRMKGIRVAPTLVEPLKISLKKEKVKVVFPDKMAKDQTYILTASRDISDEHGNRLDRSYQMAFSTGETISDGAISGSVFGQKGLAAVYLYRVDTQRLDSLFLETPDYFTQTDDSGRFTFSFLEPGSYQILGFEGGSPPSPIAPSRVPYGVHWDVPVLIESDSMKVPNINMRLSAEPAPFRVITSGMPARSQGLVRMTNPFSLDLQHSLDLVILDTVENRQIEPGLLFQYEEPSNELRFRVENLIPGGPYVLILSGVKDLMNQIMPSYAGRLRVPERLSDSLRIVAPDPSGLIRFDPGETPLSIQFNDVVPPGIVEEAIQILDTSGSALGVRFEWKNPTRIQVIPEGGWREEQVYEVRFSGYHLGGDIGTVAIDSLVTFKVRSGPVAGIGGLAGILTGRHVEHSTVVARSLENPSISYSTAVNSQGSFEFEKIPAGFWLLSAYQDRDGNARYSRGRAVPFKPAEPFHPFPDTLEVRANWTVEGLELGYPGH